MPDLVNIKEGGGRVFLTVSQAAAELGVAVDTVRRWCDQGKLRSYRTPGNQRRIPVDAVAELKGAAA